MKRSRTSSGGGLSSLKRGQIAGARFNNLHPWSSYGAARVQRGTPYSLSTFGKSAKSASAAQKAARRGTGFTGNGLYTGKGGFWGDVWEGTKGLRSAIGGSLRGGGAGAWGRAAGHAMEAAGIGEYTTTVANPIVNDGAGMPVPSFRKGAVGAVTISHREYISDIFGPAGAGTFQNTVYPINPGVITTFPWLSQIATNYEEYTLKQLIFFYRSTVTDFVATNGQVGSVIMATQYNPSDAPFASKQDAMEYDLAVSGKVSGNVMAGVECDPKQLSGSVGKYVRAGPVRSDDDLKSYDVGNLNMCISNIPQQFANQALGELWVSYTVELRKPKFFVSRGLAIARDSFMAGTGSDQLNANTIGKVEPVAYAQQNRIGGTLANDRSDIATFDDMVQYTFPAQFSGNVVLKFTVWPDTTSGSGLVSYIAGGNTTSGTNNTAPNVIPSNMVSITPIRDMWDVSLGVGQALWAYQRQSGASSYASGDPATVEIHATIKSPTTAASFATTGGGALTPVVDNTFTFLYQSVGAPFNNLSALSWSLDVSVYNTGFNYPTTGNLILMNSVTDLQESWPPVGA